MLARAREKALRQDKADLEQRYMLPLRTESLPSNKPAG